MLRKSNLHYTGVCQTGFKFTRPSLYIHVWGQGWIRVSDQWAASGCSRRRGPCQLLVRNGALREEVVVGDDVVYRFRPSIVSKKKACQMHDARCKMKCRPDEIVATETDRCTGSISDMRPVTNWEDWQYQQVYDTCQTGCKGLRR